MAGAVFVRSAPAILSPVFLAAAMLLCENCLLKVPATSDDMNSEWFRDRSGAHKTREGVKTGMPQFQAYSQQVMVNGQTVLSVISGMGAFRETAVQILQRNGIRNPAPTAWYPQQAWLNAFREIANTIGLNTLYQIGKSIPGSAKFPPGIDTVEKALASIDIAYHLNHRSGEIGHYSFEKTGPSKGTMTCKNPYPCEFDRGLIEAMASQFKLAGAIIRVQHDSAKPCRSKQGESCTYAISW
jgi:hypothetical protein